MGAEATDLVAEGRISSTAAGLCAWIESGACQTASGAFAAWVDAATGSPAFEYPEITGYALTFLAGRALSEKAWAVGNRAAAWLLDRIRRGNLVARDGRDNDAVYLFDLAMVASGLLSFGRRAEHEQLVETGHRLVDFLDRELDAAGPISPRARGRRPDRRGWSTDGIPHLAKLAQCFLLSEHSASGRSLGRLIESVEGHQKPDGRMTTDPEDALTMLHPHLYAAEGLWIWGQARGDEEALERAGAALDWAWEQQLPSGGLPRAAAPDDRSEKVEQTDATAQAVRLALVLDRRTPPVERAIGRLVELARGSAGTLSLAYQPVSPVCHLNTWTTLFAAQALTMATPGASVLAWPQLV
jgi:hypothetical protein